MFFGGKAAARLGDNGWTNCLCCGSGYTNVEGSSKVYVGGKPVVRVGDSLDIHGQGTGQMTTGSTRVFIGG